MSILGILTVEEPSNSGESTSLMTITFMAGFKAKLTYSYTFIRKAFFTCVLLLKYWFSA